jgi:hypothetical protein
VKFSTEELDFFSNIFTETSNDSMISDSQNQLSMKTSVPDYLRQVLVGSKLSMLAEISHYQLWFPVALSISAQGDFLPKFGTPEIIDVKGSERSWRVTTPKNIAIIDIFHDQKMEVLSLSTTGLTLKVLSSDNIYNYLQQSSFQMSLAGEKPLKLELDLVRYEENIVAAKFKDLQEGRESLRKFIFKSYKVKYSNLNQNIIL